MHRFMVPTLPRENERLVKKTGCEDTPRHWAILEAAIENGNRSGRPRTAGFWGDSGHRRTTGANCFGLHATGGAAGFMPEFLGFYVTDARGFIRIGAWRRLDGRESGHVRARRREDRQLGHSLEPPYREID